MADGCGCDKYRIPLEETAVVIGNFPAKLSQLLPRGNVRRCAMSTWHNDKWYYGRILLPRVSMSQSVLSTWKVEVIGRAATTTTTHTQCSTAATIRHHHNIQTIPAAAEVSLRLSTIEKYRHEVSDFRDPISWGGGCIRFRSPSCCN